MREIGTPCPSCCFRMSRQSSNSREISSIFEPSVAMPLGVVSGNGVIWSRFGFNSIGMVPYGSSQNCPLLFLLLLVFHPLHPPLVILVGAVLETHTLDCSHPSAVSPCLGNIFLERWSQPFLKESFESLDCFCRSSLCSRSPGRRKKCKRGMKS